MGRHKHRVLRGDGAAGCSTGKRILKEKRAPKAVAKTGPADFSLLQPGYGQPEVCVRLDPSTFTEAAGGLVRPDPFFENGRPGMTRIVMDKTDPITHFKHEGLDSLFKKPNTKRFGYTSSAAASKWTPLHDARLSAKLKSVDIRPTVSIGADGLLHYNIWGVEDLRRAGGREAIKCDWMPDESHIIFNDKDRLPYCLREGLTQKRPVHSYTNSSRIWGIMRDEPYMKQLLLESEETPESVGFKKYWKDRLERHKETQQSPSLSEDENEDLIRVEQRQGHRRMRASRSLPPERLPCHGSSHETVTQAMCPMYSASDLGSTSRSSMPPDSKGPFLSMAPRSVHRNSTTPRGSINRDAQRVLTARDAKQNATASTNSDISQNRMTPWRGEPASKTTSRSVTPRSSMTPISITNSWVAARRGSTPRNVKPRNSTPPPSVQRTRSSGRS